MTRLTSLAVLAGMLLVAPALAEDSVEEELRARINALDSEFTVDSIRPTPVDGLYEIVSGTDVMYITREGRFLIQGQVIDLEQRRNLTRERHGALVHDMVESLGEDSMVVYQPEGGNARASVTVFTDTTCPYCQRLHQELMGMVDRHDIKVRYLMYPRAGLSADSADTLRDIWCADDPQAAMTAAKSGSSVPEREPGCETPIDAHWATANRIGIRGTPHLLINDDGPVVAGYRSEQELLRLMGIARAASSAEQ